MLVAARCAVSVELLESRRLFAAGTISGYVRLDQNNDGVAEKPLQAVSVFFDLNGNNLRDEGEPTVFTEGEFLQDGVTPNPTAGRYTFGDLGAGTYNVRVQPAHYHRVFEPGSNNGTYTINLGDGQNVSNQNFGVFNVASLGGIAYIDANGDGEFTFNNPDSQGRPGAGDDPLIVGATAYLDLNLNNQLDNGEPTNTTRNWISFFWQNFNFRDLDPGTYTVRLTNLPTGYNGPTPGSYTLTVGAGEEPNRNFRFTSSTPQQPVRKVDFNDDGKTDILFRSGSSSTFWAMNGPSRLSAGALQGPGAAWSLGAAADFNGDGHTDVVYHNNATGESRIWIHNSVTSSQQVDLPVLGNTNWRIVAAGDFNQDGKNDIVWRNIISGQNTLWLMNGTSVANFRALPSTADQNWAVAGVGDFNNDGIDDIVWRNGVNGRNTLWILNGQQRIQQFKALDYTADTKWTIASVDDVDNDGDPDLFWRNATLNRNLLWTYNGTQRTGFSNVVL
jgi:hypothetical protein